MKLTFKPSPNYRSAQSTSGMMKDLTLCLLAVTVFSVVYYGVNYGASAGLRVVILMVTSVASALVTEAIWFKATKQDIKEGILSSYGWVTAMILTLISSINVSPYALAVCTVIAIVFGKLVFGGFGQNIFNPAAFGEAIIMNYFTSSNIDLMTSTTPTTAMNATSWLGDGAAVSSVLSKYGGVGSMLVGWYPSTIGSTCAVLLIACLVFMIIRGVVDWQGSVFYIGTVFVLSLIIGLIHGSGINYAIVNVLAGGVLFGGVFMTTDPVTTPVTLPGKILYGIGAACFTLLFRMKSNLADGVLYSILLMNMLTPAIDKLFDGNQIKDAGKIKKNLAIVSAVAVALILLVGGLSETKTATATTVTESGPATSTTGEVDYSDYEAVASEVSNDGTTAVYDCSAKGFGLLNGMDGYSENEVTVTINLADNTVESIELVNFGDTPGVGDQATTDDALAAYVGVSSASEVDTVSGATFTSTSVASMVQAALDAASGN